MSVVAWQGSVRRAAVHPAAARRRAAALRRRRLYLLAAVLLLAVLLVPWVVRAHQPRAMTPSLVAVQAGDTLWSIAGRYVADGADRRPFIYEVSKLNHLSGGGMLQPGQTLVIPPTEG